MAGTSAGAKKAWATRKGKVGATRKSASLSAEKRKAKSASDLAKALASMKRRGEKATPFVINQLKRRFDIANGIRTKKLDVHVRKTRSEATWDRIDKSMRKAKKKGGK